MSVAARIDALGIHEVGLYKLDEAVRFLTTWLPRGTLADPDPAIDAESLLPSSERSALVTVTHYTADESAEVAGASTDLILVRHDGRLHILSRDAHDRTRLVPHPQADIDLRRMLRELLT